MELPSLGDQLLDGVATQIYVVDPGGVDNLTRLFGDGHRQLLRDGSIFGMVRQRVRQRRGRQDVVDISFAERGAGVSRNDFVSGLDEPGEIVFPRETVMERE